MKDKIRWGILGTGDIARQFAHDLQLLDDAELCAVGSRRQQTADDFARTHGISRAYPTYQELARDPDIDVVYVASPHTEHVANARLCLDAGKAVLCEKPLAINAQEARGLMESARDKRQFLMEGMWTRCFPAIQRVKECLASGHIGAPRHVRADFCYHAEWNPASRLFDPKLAGGALLDLGVYTVTLADLVFEQAPSAVMSVLHIGESGVDEQAALTLHFGDEGTAALTCSLRVHSPQEALIAGTEGHIVVEAPFSQPDAFSLHRNGTASRETFERTGYGYAFEAREVMRCLREELLESPLVPHERTLAVLETVDKARQQWDYMYPVESAPAPASM